MKKVMFSTVLGIVSSALAALPLMILSSAAHAEREVIRVERPVVANPNGRNIGGNVQDGIVNNPIADAEAVRIARENADYDNDGVINVNDPDDDNDGISDAQDPDDDNDGVSDDQDTD